MLNNNEHVCRVSVCMTLFNELLVGGWTPIIFYALLIDTININASAQSSRVITDLFVEDDSRIEFILWIKSI